MEWSESRPRHDTKDGKSIRDNTLPRDLMKKGKKEKGDLPSTKGSSRTSTVYAALSTNDSRPGNMKMAALQEA